MFVNNSNKKLRWSLDVERGGALIENGTFQFLHRSGSPYSMSSHNAVELIPSKMLDSGETSHLGVLFTPRKLFRMINKTLSMQLKGAG